MWGAHVLCVVLYHSMSGAARGSWPKRIVGAIVLAAVTLSFDWSQAVWCCFLAGLAFSRLLFTDDLPAFVSELFLLIFLGVVLSLLIVPGLYLDQSTAEAYRSIAWIPLGVLLTFLATLEVVILARKTPLQSESDYVSTLLFALTMGFLILLAVVVETHSELPLHSSIAVTLGVGLVAALALTLLWSPFSRWGLGTVVARHLFPTTVPLDKWAQRMSELATVSADAEQFLANAVDELRAASRLERIEWEKGAHNGSTAGGQSRHKTVHEFGGLKVGLYSKRRTTHIQALINYFRLEILAFFYVSKQREVRYGQEQGSLLVKEAGLRLSHDIKNILHSIKAITGLSETAKEERIASIVRNQLPEIGRRLEDALRVIDQPELELEHSQSTISATLWWAKATKRFEGIVDRFRLDADIDQDDLLRANLYDRAAENFISNALKKREKEPDLRIAMRLRKLGDEAIGLEVADTGSSIPAGLADKLFKSRVQSLNGSGIGLYDLCEDARKLNHNVLLASNESGSVNFAIRPLRDREG